MSQGRNYFVNYLIGIQKSSQMHILLVPRHTAVTSQPSLLLQKNKYFTPPGTLYQRHTYMDEKQDLNLRRPGQEACALQQC